MKALGPPGRATQPQSIPAPVEIPDSTHAERQTPRHKRAKKFVERAIAEQKAMIAAARAG